MKVSAKIEAPRRASQRPGIFCKSFSGVASGRGQLFSPDIFTVPPPLDFYHFSFRFFPFSLSLSLYPPSFPVRGNSPKFLPSKKASRQKSKSVFFFFFFFFFFHLSASRHRDKSRENTAAKMHRPSCQDVSTHHQLRTHGRSVIMVVVERIRT